MADGLPETMPGETWLGWSARQQATGQSPLVIEVKGLEELQAALAKFPSQWNTLANRALKPGLAMLESEAAQLSPVDTGVLRASITSRVERTAGSEVVGKVGSKLEYASYQEYGTRYQSGKPYLRPALERNLSRVLELFERGIDEALRILGLK